MAFYHNMKAFSRAEILFVLVMMSFFTGKSQTIWIDSLKKVAAVQQPDTIAVISLIMISEAYQHYYPDSAMAYAHRALGLAEKLKYDNGIFFSIVNIHKALSALGNYALDLDYAFKAQAIGLRINTPFAQGWSNGMVGDCYFNLGEYEAALQYFRKVMKIAEVNASPDLHQIYCNIAPVLIKLHQYDSALFYARKGYALFKQNPELNNSYEGQYSKSFMFRFLGDAFAGKLLYDSSLFYYYKSLPYSKDINLELNEVDVYNGMALVYKDLKQLDSATNYAKKVFVVKMIRSYPLGSFHAANTLADVYQIRNETDSTLKYLRMALSIRDSLFSRGKTVAVQNIFFKEQEKQREVLAARTEMKNRYKLYLIVGLLISLGIIATIVLRNRVLHRLMLVRNQIAYDLHDDIGSTLCSISIMNELVKTKSGDDALQLLASIGENTTTIQENMSDIIWAIQSGNDRFDNVFQRMNEFAAQALGAKSIDFNFISDPALFSMKLPIKMRKNFYLFFKEVITNVTKHSEAKMVSIRIKKQKRSLDMSISDDGKGFDTTGHFNGNGLSTLRKRATELKGDLKIVSNQNNGTDVQLNFKII